MSGPRTCLFVPATRLDRVPSAWASGCDAVIVDLEDAVADADKETAREQVAAAAFDVPVHVRTNAPGTPFHDDDLAAVATVRSLAGVVVPMVESPDGVAGAEAAGWDVNRVTRSARSGRWYLRPTWTEGRLEDRGRGRLTR